MSQFYTENFQWVLALPADPAPIRQEDYTLPPAERRSSYQEDVPMNVLLACDRSSAYENRHDLVNAIRWTRIGIDQTRPDSDFAQFMRGGLANTYEKAHRWDDARATLREVIAVKQRYPRTWGYYADNARSGLKSVTDRERKARAPHPESRPGH